MKALERWNEQAKKASRSTKTNHLSGYHKPIKNPTTNYPMDTHKAFCKRCEAYNKGCPRPEGKAGCNL